MHREAVRLRKIHLLQPNDTDLSAKRHSITALSKCVNISLNAALYRHVSIALIPYTGAVNSHHNQER